MPNNVDSIQFNSYIIFDQLAPFRGLAYNHKIRKKNITNINIWYIIYTYKHDKKTLTRKPSADLSRIP